VGNGLLGVFQHPTPLTIVGIMLNVEEGGREIKVVRAIEIVVIDGQDNYLEPDVVRSDLYELPLMLNIRIVTPPYDETMAEKRR